MTPLIDRLLALAETFEGPDDCRLCSLREDALQHAQTCRDAVAAIIAGEGGGWQRISDFDRYVAGPVLLWDAEWKRYVVGGQPDDESGSWADTFTGEQVTPSHYQLLPDPPA